MFKKTIVIIITILDKVLIPFTYLSSFWLITIRKVGFVKMKSSKKVLLKCGIIPVINNYYEPFYNPNILNNQDFERTLPGINLNIDFQINLLKKFNYHHELSLLPAEKKNEAEYFYKNPNFGPGDAEYLYSLIRYIKPKNFFEIGSGFSTLITLNAINKNKESDPDYNCKIMCIEPYEMKWLEKTRVELKRESVENLKTDIFKELKENDILFIDSTHVVKPQNDVLYEYLQILPSLNSGVYIHIHDIFTPRDYPDVWLKDEMRLWNEQYFLESFISNNSDFKIAGMLNYLKNHHFDVLSEKFPMLKMFPDSNPGSFWMIKK